MKTKKIFYILILCIICLVFTSIVIIKHNKYRRNKFENNNTMYQNNVSIEEIKNELGYTADSSLYNIDTEYDGRKVLRIKPNIQFMVAFDGIIKPQDLELSKIESIFNENYPKQCGIWIEKNSREHIIEIINKNTKSIYKINNEGYLEIEEKKEQNDLDVVLEKLINSNFTIILSINSFYFEIDNVTGEIVQYPFEQLDNYQPLDMIKSENNVFIVLSSNENNKLTDKQILDELFIIFKENILLFEEE